MVLLPAMVPLSTGKPATGLTAVALVLVRYSTRRFCRMFGNLNLQTCWSPSAYLCDHQLGQLHVAWQAGLRCDGEGDSRY